MIEWPSQLQLLNRDWFYLFSIFPFNCFYSRFFSDINLPFYLKASYLTVIVLLPFVFQYVFPGSLVFSSSHLAEVLMPPKNIKIPVSQYLIKTKMPPTMYVCVNMHPCICVCVCMCIGTHAHTYKVKNLIQEFFLFKRIIIYGKRPKPAYYIFTKLIHIIII